MGAGPRFALFCAIVLIAPGAVMALGGPRMVDLGKLVLILSPAVAGLALNPGLGRWGARRWGQVGVAAAVTLAVAGGALAVALAFGAARLGHHAPQATPVAATLLTSVLEELGWAGGGIALAVKALGRRWGVVVLGLVWAAWHLVPAFLRIGLFPELETAPPAMLAAFVASCLVYRELLTRLVERAGTWLAAAAGHAAPNLLLAGLMSGGAVLPSGPGDWPLFPAPGGLAFLALAALAVWGVGRMRDTRRSH